MELVIGIMRLCAGIGLFLFSIYLLEESLKNLSGRRFKLFLQRSTRNRVRAVAGGAIVTGILQSSSMVSMMVLAFVGAGVFTLKSALGIILGANLGTTIDSWLVASLGFNSNVEIVAYPVIFVGGLLLILFGKRKSVKFISWFLVGFGLLFIGLAFMKTGMEAQVAAFDFSQYKTMPLIVFVLIGFVITLLVQSSSMTMALTLTALHVGAVEFAAAVAIVIGSETGTTIKIMLSALGGTALKKRVVLGNILFNVVLTVLAFVFLRPMIILITDIFNISDPLIGLVTFSTLVNLISIALFLPFLNAFSDFLERFFKDSDTSYSAFIGNADISDTQTSLDLFRRETAYFIHNSMIYNCTQLGIESNVLNTDPDFKQINDRRKFMLKSDEEKYEFLKFLQGEIQLFYLGLRTKLDGNENIALAQMASAVRSAMHSVKSMSGLNNNISNLNRSSKDIKFEFFVLRKKQAGELYEQLHSELIDHKSDSYKNLEAAYQSVQNNYETALVNFYKDVHGTSLEGMDITMVINFNRELFTSDKAMLMAVKDFILEEKEASEFNEIPVYRT